MEKSDRERILSKLDEMRKYVEELQSMLPDQEEYQEDLIKRRACEKKVFSRELGEKLKDVKGFRNILIHRYGHVDDAIVYHNLGSYMKDFHEFENAIELYLKKQKI